jgi:acetolactate synthase-1/3 small subunit
MKEAFAMKDRLVFMDVYVDPAEHVYPMLIAGRFAARHETVQDGAYLIMRRIISVLMENEPGALSRLVGLFSQRGYNIESLTSLPTDDVTLSRLTLTTTGDEQKIEQVTKQLNKLIEVVKVVDLTEGAHIERELMLVKVKATGAARAELKRTADIFRGQIVDVTPTVYTIQLAGTSDKLDAFHRSAGRNVHSRSGAYGRVWYCPWRKSI